jgi:hypothetical protein
MIITVTKGVWSINVEMSCIVKDKGYGPTLANSINHLCCINLFFLNFVFLVWFERNTPTGGYEYNLKNVSLNFPMSYNLEGLRILHITKQKTFTYYCEKRDNHWYDDMKHRKDALAYKQRSIQV